MDDTIVEPAAASNIAEYTQTAAALGALAKRYANVVWDCSTSKGDRDARAVRKELVTLRTSLDKMRLQLNADDQERIRARNAEAKRIAAQIEELERPVDDAIKAEEARREAERLRKAAEEQQRVDAIQQRINIAIRTVATTAAPLCSTDISARITTLAGLAIDDSFQEFREAAETARGEALTALRDLHAAAAAREAEAARIATERAELERLRAEAAERDRLENERRERAAAEERQRLAAERAAFEAQQAAARAEQEKRDAEARAAREKADREAAEARAEADRIAREKREAEQRRLDGEAAELRRQREEQEARERAEREAAEAQARAEREAAEAQARAEREAQEAAQRRLAGAAALMLDALRQWATAEASGDAAALQAARVARDAAIVAATVDSDDIPY